MELALHSFFVSLPQAVAVWMIMLLAVAGAAAALALPRRVRETPAPDPDHVRYSDEVAVATDRAAATASRHRAEWIGAQQELDLAWFAYDQAEREARQAARAAVYPLLSRRRKLGDNVDRERYLHHAATRACRERQLSIAQLNDVLAHRGWNPRLHPVLQEGVLKGAIREHLRAALSAAQERERAAWETAEKAAESLRSLRIEVAQAAARHTGVRQPASDEQWWADQWTTAEIPAVA